MDKKSNPMTIIFVIIIIAIIALIVVKNNQKNKQLENLPTDQTEIELQEAVNSDSLQSINDNLNNIDLSDTSEEELKTIDQELQKL